MLLAAAAIAPAAVVAEYAAGEAASDPVASGWKEIKGAEAAVAGPASGPRKGAWRIGDADGNVNRLAYRWQLPINSFEGKAWRAEAVLRVESASAEKARDAFLEVQDGISEWAIVFAKDAKVEGVGYMDRDNQWQSIYDGDVSSKPVTVEMSYVPSSDSIKVRINGVEKEITREAVPSAPVAGRYFITWGDGASAAKPGKIPSEVFWESVKFETKP